MRRPTDHTLLPAELRAFAAATTGEYHQRFELIVERAFMNHGLMLNAAQLRRLCGGGAQETAQRAVNGFRETLRQRVSGRLSACALALWMEQGMPQEMPELSPKEKLVANVFLRQVSRMTRPAGAH